jgi:hypothetical protein
MCFDIDAVTPSDASISKYQIVREWTVTRTEGGQYDVSLTDETDTKKPLTVYNNSRTVFSDWLRN